jgi:O-antigen/teichoic acid export membrane protein
MPASVKRNTFYNIIKTLSTIIFPLITFPYVSRVLGVENLGKINFSSSIISYISLLATLGVSAYAIRECSKVKDDKIKISQTASEIYSINVFSTIFAYIVLAVVLIFWQKIHSYKLLILLYSINVIMNTLGADWINSAMEDFKYITIRTFCFQILSLILMFLFVRKPTNYVFYVIISVISASGGNLLNVLYRRKYCKISFLGLSKVTEKNKTCSGIHWKLHMPHIMLLFAMILAQTIFVNVDTTMLGIMRNDREVGLYSTSTKIYNMVNQIIASIAWVVMPQLSYWFRKAMDNRATSNDIQNDYIEINKLLKYSLNFIIVFGMPCIVGLFTLAPEVIELVGGKTYMDAVPSLRILCIALAFSLLGGFYGNIILLPSGREKVCLFTCIVAAVVNFILNWLMIPRWGLNAAAFTTALSQLLALLLGLPFIEKEIKIDHLSKLLTAPVIGSTMVVVLVMGIQRTKLSLLPRSLVAVTGSVLVYSFVLLLLRNEFALNICKTIKNKLAKQR